VSVRDPEFSLFHWYTGLFIVASFETGIILGFLVGWAL